MIYQAKSQEELSIRCDEALRSGVEAADVAAMQKAAGRTLQREADMKEAHRRLRIASSFAVKDPESADRTRRAVAFAKDIGFEGKDLSNALIELQLYDKAR